MSKTSPARRAEVIFSMFQNVEQRCARSRTHKVIRAFSPQRLWKLPIDLEHSQPAIALPTPYLQFFDLVADPLETNNLAGNPDCRDELEQLDAALFSWMQDVGDPLLETPTPTPYYLAAIADYRTRRN